MFHRILVPLDFTAKNARALRVASQIAGASPGAEVVLLHVVEKIEGAPAELRGFYRTLERSAKAKMRPLVARLEKAGRAVREAIIVGNRVEEIVRCAADSGADLIVMSSHRVDPERARDWGTISYKVGILARCAVLLVK